MKNRNSLSRTAQRGYLYLALILVIVVILVAWPAPESEPIPPEDAAIVSNSDSTQYQRNWNNKYHRSYKRNAKDNNNPYSHDNTTTRPYYKHESIKYDTQRFFPKRKPLTVDINTADTLTLQLLHGIGPAYARRIVKYRNRLGGFVAKEQILEVYGMTPELYHHIETHLTISDSITRININQIGLKQLVKHPYIDYYQARDVIAYRNKGHRYNSCDDLRLVISMDDSTIARLCPYLDFGSETPSVAVE